MCSAGTLKFDRLWNDHLSMIATAGIYALLNEKRKRGYVGSSTDIDRRLAQHMIEFSRGTHTNPRMQNDYNEDGGEAFAIIICHEVQDPESQEAELEIMERYFIAKFGAEIELYNSMEVFRAESRFLPAVLRLYARFIENRQASDLKERRRKYEERLASQALGWVRTLISPPAKVVRALPEHVFEPDAAAFVEGKLKVIFKNLAISDRHMEQVLTWYVEDISLLRADQGKYWRVAPDGTVRHRRDQAEKVPKPRGRTLK